MPRDKGYHKIRAFTENPKRRRVQKSYLKCEAIRGVPEDNICAYFNALDPSYQGGVCEGRCAFRNFRGKER